MTNQPPNNTEAELESLLSRINALSANSPGQRPQPAPPRAAAPNAAPQQRAPQPGLNAAPQHAAPPQPAPQQRPAAPQPGQPPQQRLTPQQQAAQQHAAQQQAAQHAAQQQAAQQYAAQQQAAQQHAAQQLAAQQQAAQQHAAPQHSSQPQAAPVMPQTATPATQPSPQFTAPAPGKPAIPGLFDDDGVKRDKHQPFTPAEPKTLEEARLTETDVEQLLLKFLFARGEASGRDIAEQICLPFGLVEVILRQLKHEQLVAYKDATQMNDYVYVSTELGRERGRRFMQDCSYFGSATVDLVDYIHSVKEQSLTFQNPSRADLQEAFSDLLINQKMFNRLGPAINSGRGMFLFGFPGNGKTSIAERVTQAFGKYIYIPRAIGLHGDIIRLFDPNHHEEVPLEANSSLLNESKIDKRWVRIKRPTIVVGGELTMAQLELQYNEGNGTNEAPIQLKSNCGTLVIDDFGRQKMSTDELLNRWIVPLEKRYDFLNMPSGKSVQVPFDQLVVFSTNLEPRDLVDDAFLRRIPYKIEVENPSEEEFIALFQIMCPIMGFEYNEAAIRYVIDTHYKPINRPFRCCQPRDLLLQIKNYCLYQREEVSLTPQRFDFAVENYFAVM